MSLPGNGIFVVKGEMAILMTAMRRGSRWSSHSHQDDDLDTLMKAFQDLKAILNKIDDLKTLEPNVFLNPFLEVIRSEETTGPVTSLALSAVNKFLSYGLVDPTHSTVTTAVHNIADAVNHARFVGTDQASDGVVLMKILQVLRTLTLAPEGASLTNESLCEIMLSCFRICFETRLNELLRRTAEHYLKDMVQLVFMRLPQFSEDLHLATIKQLKMRPGAVEQTRTKRKHKTSFRNKNKSEKAADTDDTSKQVSSVKLTTNNGNSNIVDMQGSISQAQVSVESNDVEKGDSDSHQQSLASVNSEVENEATINDKLEEVEAERELEHTETLKIETNSIDEQSYSEHSQNLNQDYVNPRGIRFTPQNQDEVILIPYGLPSVRELFRFLISLCNPMDKQNTDVMIHLGLTLLTVVFEVSADSLGKYSSLLSLVKDELCRNLFSLLNTERISVFAADLQVSFLLFESLRTHLKFQLEFYLTKLIEIIVSDSVKITYEHKEIALDNILQLWRIPGFVTELYLNYDCDMYCTNLYEDLTKLLAKNAFPVTAGVYPTHLLSLDALLTVIESIEGHCNKKNDLNRKNSVGHVNQLEVVEFNKLVKAPRQKTSNDIPTREDLLKIKNIKRWLPTGTEHFNHKPKKGIQFLQEHGVLKPELDPQEIVVFLRENPGLDKKMIGEYISGRNNLQVLEAFVKMFDFNDLRIDEALRLYLETFRLPGEAPLISLLLEHFAEHWHKCNGEPFANADAAFTLAYAVIMLNVDQHNHNVKKQNIPMTAEDFKKNLKKVNGGNDFDQDMLDEIYISIKNEEIVMPAEQTGVVRENYLWKVLLRRGASKDGVYVHVSNDTYDIDLFSLIWGPTVAALSFVFDKSDDANVYKRAIQGFERCAYISAHFGMTQNLDMLILSLCKFTQFHNQQKQTYNNIVQFGFNLKAQMALKTVFSLTHHHGDNIREGWKNIFDLIFSLYSHNLLPKLYTEAEDFIESSGKIILQYEEVQNVQKQDTGLFSSLYSYMVSSENLTKVPTPEEQELIDAAKLCIKECNLEQVILDSKFLHDDSLIELVKSLIELSRGPDVQKSLGYNYNENVAVFFLELLVKIVIQNRDRVMTIWQMVRDHLYTLVMNASHCDYQFLLERAVIGLLRLAIRLMRNEDMSPIVIQSLRMLLLLKSATLFRISRQISFGLYELLKTSAQNIHSNSDWSIIFTLLECVGAGAQPPKPIVEDSQVDQGTKSECEGPVSSEEESPNSDRGYTSDSELSKSPKHSARSQSPIIVPITHPSNSTGGWILVGSEGEMQPVVGRTLPPSQYSLALERNLGPHDPSGLVKCCESLAFLVRDVAHITPYNFDDCVHCIRTFVEASLHGKKRARRTSNREQRHRRKTGRRYDSSYNRKRSPTSSPDEEEESDEENLPSGYHQISIQLLDLMHTLHTRTAQIFRWWAEEGGEIAQETSLWTQGWCPLLQGIARLCCDIRRQVRMTAITYLQRALLVHDLQTLTGVEWEACFHRVLFPLLAYLLQPIVPNDPISMEETRMRAATVLSKVFLHHLTPLLSLQTFSSLWLTILDFMDKYMHADKSDLLYEAIPESLKNMLLVMDSAKVFESPEGHNQLWSATWDRIATFLPHMKEELFRETEKISENPAQVEQNLTSVTQTQPVVQHNIETATKSSIILQPLQQPNIASPLFAHLGQMVSTPIGPITDCVPNTNTVNTASPTPATSSYTNFMPNVNPQGHTFPVLYNSPIIMSNTTESQPISLYTEYMGNPYNIQLQSPEAKQPNVYVNYEQNPADTPHSYQNLQTNAINEGQQNQINLDFNKNSDSQMQRQGNVFQSSNYFYTDTNTSYIPPGSEILFGSNDTGRLAETSNIPLYSNDIKTTNQ